MKKRYLFKSALFGFSILAASVYVGTSTSAVSAQPGLETALETPFETGANSLFAGHSFFVPVAVSFNEIGREMGFEDHRVQFVFAGGRKGTPGALWKSKDKRNDIDSILKTGRIELFGLVAGGGGGSEADDFAKWVDLALSYNPDTAFMISRAWTTGGPRTHTDKFDSKIDANGAALHTIVETLRARYPRVEFHLINYGKTASAMKRAFEAGELEDIREMTGRSQTALFRDRRLGHAGQMMLDVSALYWIHRLYGVEISELPSLDYNAQNVSEILSEVAGANPRID